MDAAHANPAAAPATGRRPTLSFEFMPPRLPGSAPRFWDTVERLMVANPDYISITYGAGGQDRQTSHEVVAQLLRSGLLTPIAHLTCVGASRHGVEKVIDEFLDAGARHFLALRGDPPRDDPHWRPPDDGVRSALELVAMLRERAARRALVPRTRPSHPGSGEDRPALTIAVAAFPAGNPAAGTTATQEVARLADKQRAGADFAITQLFYEASTYVDFVGAARRAGVTIPIVAGILPITEPGRLAHVRELTGLVPPDDLLRALQDEPDPKRRVALGIRRTADMVRDVLAAGAPGLHVYTFNRHEPALALLDELGWIPNRPQRADVGTSHPRIGRPGT